MPPEPSWLGTAGRGLAWLGVAWHRNGGLWVIEFTVLGKPEPAGSKRAFRTTYNRIIVTDANKNAKPWMAEVKAAALEAMVNGRVHELLRGPLVLETTFYFTRPKSHYGTGRNADQVKPGAPLYPHTRPDTTKLLRAVEDALTGVVWRDDGQVVNQWARKMYGEPTRVEVKIEELE